ncbi:ABC transporter ATP-binding protein [Saccharibacillus sp. CPCC 101409]|uniref:ABC transporter ATP-binding protein n=1 Tax=Saccharibacillus sp. CPCC 101409 TaxID=3058041 RepID=UPI0026723E5F|nr:ABC transporter ATP-binding protein [Saccharibacillus sp. CPCC 101409]MDO3408884.1 ABC transporter ATP-binding protein [Saccharibacillus sp. CPCC 101409]
MNKPVILKAVNLCKTYSTGGEQFHAIRNVSLDIYEGDFTVIMGDSGSGKSTLLYLLSGMDELTSGEIHFGGDRIDRYNERKAAAFRSRQIGYVYQSINLVPDLTLFENIALPGYISGMSRAATERRAEELMAGMDIADLKSRLPSQVSGGQQQRAAIARSLLHSPALLFADEPTGSLNHAHGAAVLDILTRFNLLGQSIVMVTHDIRAAARADRLILIRDGRIGGELDFAEFPDADTTQREEMIFAFVTGKE